MSEALLYTIGKPDTAGSLLPGPTHTWKPVYAGGLVACIRETRQSGRPRVKYTIVDMEAGLCRKPYCMHRGKPDIAGGPLQESAYTWKPVSAGGLIVCIREAREIGRPGGEYTVRYMEAGLCRRPYCIHLGSPTLRGAHYKDLHFHGSRSMPEALLCL